MMIYSSLTLAVFFAIADSDFISTAEWSTFAMIYFITCSELP